MLLSLHASKQAQNHTNCAHCYAGNGAQEFQSERRERRKTHPGCSNIKLKPALNGLLPSELANNQICTCTAHTYLFLIFSAADRGVYGVRFFLLLCAFYFRNLAIINSDCAIAANMRRTITIAKYVQYLPKLHLNTTRCFASQWRWEMAFLMICNANNSSLLLSHALASYTGI